MKKKDSKTTKKTVTVPNWIPYAVVPVSTATITIMCHERPGTMIYRWKIDRPGDTFTMLAKHGHRDHVDCLQEALEALEVLR